MLVSPFTNNSVSELLASSVNCESKILAVVSKVVAKSIPNCKIFLHRG